MKMIRLNNFRVEGIDNPGCNNGNYPLWDAETDDGMTIGGKVCRCQRGCSGTDTIVTDENGDCYLLEDEE